MLVLVLTVGSQLTSPLFAGTQRGDRLFQESGGAVGIPGTAGPAGASGIAGAAGANGIQGIPGILGAPGILDFGDFYALQGMENGTITPGNAIQFPHTGPISTSAAIARTNSSTFILPTIGTYLVQFQADVVGPGQLALSLNGIFQNTTVVGRSTNQTQIVGISLVTTTSAGTLLQVIVPPTVGSQSIDLTPNSISVNQISAHLTITRIQ
jgi:hypothetical protein